MGCHPVEEAKTIRRLIMSEFKLTTVEEFEAATDRLLETGAKGRCGFPAAACEKIRHRIVSSVSRVSAAVSVPWDLAVLHQRPREESADVTHMVS